MLCNETLQNFSLEYFSNSVDYELHSVIFHENLTTNVLWISLYTLTLIVSILMNGMLIWTIRANAAMKTSTHILLVAIAISDTIFSPFQAINFAYLITTDSLLVHGPLCLIHDFTFTFARLVTAYSLVTISIVQYRSHVRPYLPEITIGQVLKIIFAIVMLSTILAIPRLLFIKTNVFRGRVFCSWIWKNPHWTTFELIINYFGDYMQLWNYLVPAVCLIIVYGLILKRIQPDVKTIKNKREILTSMIAVATVFIVGGIPSFIGFMLSQMSLIPAFISLSRHWKWFVFWITICGSAMLKPIVYVAMNTRIRHYLKKTFPGLTFSKNDLTLNDLVDVECAAKKIIS